MTTTENTTRPSTTPITRRKMLQSVAVTSSLTIVASVAPSQYAVAMEEMGQASAELLDLIRTHRAAWGSFGDSCNAADRMHPDYAGAEGEAIWEMRNDAEQEALRLVLDFPVRTLADAQAKASHLLSQDHGLEVHDFEDLLASFGDQPAQPRAELEGAGSAMAADTALVTLADEAERLLMEVEPLSARREVLHREWYEKADAAGVSLGSEHGLNMFKAMDIHGLENQTTAIWETIENLQTESRRYHATSTAGIYAKARILRISIGSEFSDAIPRADQDWHVLLLNELFDDMKSLA